MQQIESPTEEFESRLEITEYNSETLILRYTVFT